MFIGELLNSLPRHTRNPKKWLKKLESLFLAAGALALAVYAGAQLYSSSYEAYAAYSFGEQLQGRAASIGGFVVHLLGRTATPGKSAHSKKRAHGEDLLRSIVYAPEGVPQHQGWSVGRLRSYEKTALPPSGSILGRLEIPSLNLSVMLLEGTDAWTLNRAVGHIEGTALPGQPGNLGVAGHRDGFFRCLKDITPDATVTLTTLKGRFYYRVNGIHIVRSKDVKVLAPTAKPTLTLVTCYPFYYVGNATKRYIVTAEMIKAESASDLAAEYDSSR